MTFFWGALGYICGGFAPGYLIVRAFRIERLLPPLAGPFALSVIACGLMVETAVWFGVYTPPAARMVAGALVAIALVALARDRRLTFPPTPSAWRGLLGLIKPSGGRLRLLPLACCLAALAVLLQTLYFLTTSFGSILTGYDPVAQWNLWAVDWAANRLPNRIYHYPQLIPMLWSVPYTLMGDSGIEFFSSSFKFLFWLLTFETLAFVAWRARDFVLLLALPVAFVLIRWGIGGTSVQDSIDVPVAFFALLAVATILPPYPALERRRAVALALLIASGAAMTKQVGLYMIGAVPLLCLCWTFEKQRRLTPVFWEGLRLTWKTALAVALCAPIYIYAFVTIRNGTNISEFGYLFEGIYENRSMMARAVDALAFAYGLLGFGKSVAVVTALIGFVVVNFAALRDIRYRWILLAINLPFTCLWAMYFSYDRRNLALTLPLWALTSSVGARVLLQQYVTLPAWPTVEASPTPRPAGRAGRHGIAATLIVTVMALVLGGQAHFTAPALHARQDAIEIRILAREEPGPVAPMLSLMRQLGTPLLIFSEWRWACAFHFNRGSEKCLRIFPDEFFRSPPAALTNATSDSILLILYGASVTTERERWLQDAGFVARPVAVDSGVRCFVRVGA